MKREIMFSPAFDKTNPDPKKDYGVGCLEIRFQIVGDLGVVEFEIFTNWYQNHVMLRRLESLKNGVYLGKPDHLLKSFIEPYVTDLCYFSPIRISEDDSFWENGSYHAPHIIPCYYGYKYVDEKNFVTKDVAYCLLIEHGDEALWKYLEEYYIEVFGELR